MNKTNNKSVIRRCLGFIKYRMSYYSHLAVLYLSTLSPRKKNLMIFGAWFGNKYDDNPKYLFEYINENRKDIDAIWITPNNEVYEQVKSYGFPVCKSHTLRAIYLSLRAKYIITATSESDLGHNLINYMGGAFFIILWHGVPLKKIMFDDEYSLPLFMSKDAIRRRKLESYPHHNSYYVATSEEIVRRYISCFHSDKYHVLNLGQARNDYFYIEHKNPYREQFEGKTIILYMPTHRREGKQKMDMYKILDLEHINSLCEKYNAVFLIKKHFYHRNEPDIGNQFKCIKEITHESTPSQILLDCADILITDYSSCYIDHLLLDRPQIFYSFDLEDYLAHDRGMYEDYKPNVPGPICPDNASLLKSLEDELAGKDTYKEKRKLKRDYYYSTFNQREVSPQQTDAILKL